MGFVCVCVWVWKTKLSKVFFVPILYFSLINNIFTLISFFTWFFFQLFLRLYKYLFITMQNSFFFFYIFILKILILVFQHFTSMTMQKVFFLSSHVFLLNWKLWSVGMWNNRIRVPVSCSGTYYVIRQERFYILSRGFGDSEQRKTVKSPFTSVLSVSPFMFPYKNHS